MPKGALRTELNAVVDKMYSPLQQERSALAGDSKAVGMFHDQGRGLRGGSRRKKRDKEQRQEPF